MTKSTTSRTRSWPSNDCNQLRQQQSHQCNHWCSQHVPLIPNGPPTSTQPRLIAWLSSPGLASRMDVLYTLRQINLTIHLVTSPMMCLSQTCRSLKGRKKTQTGTQTCQSGPRSRTQRMLRQWTSQKLLIRSAKNDPLDSELKLYRLTAIYEKVTREYLARSSANTVDDEALVIEHRSACHTFTLQNTEQAKNMVIPTPQYVELLLYTKYRGKGSHYPMGTL
jgi:hypothetical protein